MGNVVHPLSVERTLVGARVAFCGDWHGNVGWAEFIIAALPDDVSRVEHVGDFGLMGWHMPEYLTRVSQACKDADIDLYVTPGNHENYTYINEHLAETSDPVKEIAPRIFIHRRGHQFEIDGVRLTSVGGAVSVDKAHRTMGIDWWPEEVISSAEFQEFTDPATGLSPTDILLTHDAPAESDIPFPISRETFESWVGSAIAREAETHRQVISGIVSRVQPTLVVHGHYHVGYADMCKSGDKDFRVIGLDMDDTLRNVIICDLEDGLTNYAPYDSFNQHLLRRIDEPATSD